MGAEAIKKLLQQIDLEHESKNIRNQLPYVKRPERDKLIKKLRIG